MRKNSKNLLYLQIAETVEHQIEQSVLLPGSRVPSVRSMTENFQVSMSTVLQAYQTLEAKGLIEARPQSGYYVKARSFSPLVKESKTTSNPHLVRGQDSLLDVIDACGNPNYIPLGSAIIHHSLLPQESLSRLLAKVSREHSFESLEYGGSRGHLLYRREIARQSLNLGLELDPEAIISTTGCMEAIFLSLLAVTKPGDVVAVESPTYHGIISAIQCLNLKVLEIATHPQTGINLDELESQIKKSSVKAVIVTPNFNNPLGSLMTVEDKERLAKIASKYEIPIIEDDIYGDLSLGSQREHTLKSHDHKNWVVLCSSFSKTLSPGYRAGWLVPGERFFHKIQKLKFSNTITSVTATQLAIAEFLKSHSYERHLRKLRTQLAQNIHLMSQKVMQTFPVGTRTSQPKGGFVIWVELPMRVKALELHQQAMTKGISVTPGPLFSASNKFQNYIRINCGLEWNNTVERAIEDLAELTTSKK